MFDKLVIGSKNSAKVERFQHLVKNIAKKIYGISDFNIDTKPEETGTTSEENAEIKAKYYSKLTNLPVFTEEEKRMHEEETNKEILNVLMNILNS